MLNLQLETRQSQNPHAEWAAADRDELLRALLAVLRVQRRRPDFFDELEPARESLELVSSRIPPRIPGTLARWDR